MGSHETGKWAEIHVYPLTPEILEELVTQQLLLIWPVWRPYPPWLLPVLRLISHSPHPHAPHPSYTHPFVLHAPRCPHVSGLLHLVFLANWKCLPPSILFVSLESVTITFCGIIDFTDVIKLKILRRGDYPGLFEWIQCHHHHLHKREEKEIWL